MHVPISPQAITTQQAHRVVTDAWPIHRQRLPLERPKRAPISTNSIIPADATKLQGRVIGDGLRVHTTSEAK